MAGVSFKYPAASGGGSSSNASVGTNGSTAPTSSTEIAGIGPTGLLTPISVDASGNLNIDIALESTISVVNSSTTPLAANGVFTGTSEDVSQYAEVRVFVFSDQASATNGLSMQQGSDGTNWDSTDTYTIASGSGKVFGIGVGARYFRLVYTNGATLQGAFRLQVIYHKVRTKPSSQKSQDGYTNETDLEQVWSFGALWNGTTWDRAPGSAAAGASVTAAQGAANTVANGWPVKITDGTSTVAVKAASTAAVATDPAQVVALSPNNNTAALALFVKNTDGTNTGAVKAASTAAVAADPALVVALSPNNNTLANALFVKNTDGSNTGAVKAASTAAVATDPALVVALSPNNNTLANALFIKNSDGTNTAAVKAASTAPIATDPALVVSISPNSVAQTSTITPTKGTLTDGSGSTSATPSTATTAAAINATRKYLFIQNCSSSATIWVNFTTTAVASQPSIPLLPYAALVQETGFISTELISVISTTASVPYVLKQA